MARAALALVGATATGKTALSLDVAEALGGEIISMDSRQVYRGMDIGTAKPGPEDRARVPHHGLDLVEPDERYSAGRFARDARGWIEEIRSRGRVPMLVGGTGFFLRALTDPLFAEPALPADRRDALRHVLAGYPDAELSRWLVRLDPAVARALGQGGGRQRRLRALEVALLTGRPLSWWQRNAPPRQPPVCVLTFVLELPRAELYRRIDARVHEMLDLGLVDEVRALLARGYGPKDPGLSATGYKEIIAHLRSELTLSDAVVNMQRASRRYARRQLTWFRHQVPEDVIRLDADRPAAELTESVVTAWKEEGEP